MAKCYECKHRGTVPGSCHSSCNVLKEAGQELGFGNTGDLLGVAVSLGMYEIINEETGEPLVKLDPHGVRNGWAAWPINFDPIWVTECPFFEEKNPK